MHMGGGRLLVAGRRFFRRLELLHELLQGVDNHPRQVPELVVIHGSCKKKSEGQN